MEVSTRYPTRLRDKEIQLEGERRTKVPTHSPICHPWVSLTCATVRQLHMWEEEGRSVDASSRSFKLHDFHLWTWLQSLKNVSLRLFWCRHLWRRSLQSRNSQVVPGTWPAKEQLAMMTRFLSELSGRDTGLQSGHDSLDIWLKLPPTPRVGVDLTEMSWNNWIKEPL